MKGEGEKRDTEKYFLHIARRENIAKKTYNLVTQKEKEPTTKSVPDFELSEMSLGCLPLVGLSIPTLPWPRRRRDFLCYG